MFETSHQRFCENCESGQHQEAGEAWKVFHPLSGSLGKEENEFQTVCQMFLHQVLDQCPGVFDQVPVQDSDKVVKRKDKGLSEFVKLVLGKPLDKSEQVSDWERRPLRRSQITYAGLSERNFFVRFQKQNAR